jgi:DNA primase
LPWAGRLAFRQDQVRMRRDHAKYLALIAASALLHQYQRQRITHSAGQACVLAAAADVEVANRLMTVALGQTLEDLLPQTRQLLVLLDDYVTRKSGQLGVARQRVRLQQRELREALGWGDFALRRHLARLVELEYVLVYRTQRGNEREYELLFDGQGRDGHPFVLGLTGAEELERQEYDAAEASPKE